MTYATLPRPRRWPARGARPAERAESTVLVADSHEDSRAICAMVLRHAGFQVLEADTGEEAIRLACAWRPRAIVMAAVLRGVDGLRALEVLRDHPLTAQVPVLIVSSVPDEAHERRARSAGCAAYLHKPCPPRHLLAEVRRCTEVAGAA